MKTRRISRIIASFAMAGVMAFTGAGAYAEEAIGTMTESQSLEVYCPANNDSEFPFNFDIDAAPESIRFVELEEPIYGFESLLDEEALVFDVKFSLKDEYMDFDGYKFGVYNADYSEEIALGYFESGEVFTIPGLALGTGYKIDMTLESETLTAYYGGQFVIQAELDSTLAVDLFYQLAKTEGEAAPYASETYENESNDTKPNILFMGRPMVASINNKDVDLFSLHIPYNMTGASDDDEIEPGVATVNFTIQSDDIMGVTATVFDENNKLLTSFGTMSLSANSKFVKINNVAMGSTIIVKITSTRNSTVDYTLKGTYKYGLAWYGQFVSKDVDGVYWNADKLANLKWGDKCIFKEGSHDKKKVCMAEACGVVSTAMIFKNLGLTMNGYDFRTDYRGTLQADPFTVMLANCLMNGTGMNVNSTTFPASYDPAELRRDFVSNGFGTNCKMLSETTKYVSAIDSSYEAELRNALSNKHFLLLYFNADESLKHFMVLTELKSEGKTFADRAIVYDPASETYAKGAGVSLSQTGWYNTDGLIPKISNVRYYY